MTQRRNDGGQSGQAEAERIRSHIQRFAETLAGDPEVPSVRGDSVVAGSEDISTSGALCAILYAVCRATPGSDPAYCQEQYERCKNG